MAAQVALRRQQAQEENEARELGLLYTSVPSSQQNGQDNLSDSQPTTITQRPSSVYQTSMPSPPSDGIDTSNQQRMQFNGSESDTEHLTLTYSPIRADVETPDSKRARISNETDQDTGSESNPSSPQAVGRKLNVSNNNSPAPTGPPSSPESDLDVDSAPDEATPENLSLKKESSASPPNTPNTPESLHLLRTFNNPGLHQGFIPYHHTQFLAAAVSPNHTHNQQHSPHHHHHHHHHHPHHHPLSHPPPQPPSQRSPVDVLARVFPNRRRSDVEQLLQRYGGDVLQAMEAILSGEDVTGAMTTVASPTSVTPSPPFPLKSAFSPLVPPVVFGSPTHRYPPFMQAHAKRFLTASYTAGAYIPSVDIEQTESNGGTSIDRNSNAGDSQD